MFKPIGFGNREMNSSSNELSKLYKKLSSGKRIENASDDPAGSALAAALEGEIRISQQSQRNILDGVSALQIADGATQQLSEIGGRMLELATQASNGTLSDSQRGALSDEFKQLRSEAERIYETTSFNNIPLLKSSSIVVQSGADGSSQSQTELNGGSQLKSSIDSLENLGLSTQDSARSTIDQLKGYLNKLGQSRGTNGAGQNRLEATRANSATLIENSSSALAQIRDLDLAEATARKTSLEIRQGLNSRLIGQEQKLDGQRVLDLLR